MKRIARVLLLLSVLVAAVAAAHSFRYSYEWASSGTAQPCTAGTCTRADPTSATEGMSLAGVPGFRLTICAASGQTLSGAGTMKAWVYHPDEAAWARNADLDQTVTVSGKRCQVFPDFLTGVPNNNRVLFAASSVTVSGGSGLDVLVDAP